MVNIGNKWDEVLAGEFEKEYYLKLRQFLIEEYKTRTIYPGMHDMFNALRYTSSEDVKAVILGQDPYHGPGQAHGMSFSVQKGVKQPPSLVNIFKEMKDGEGTPGQLPQGKGLGDLYRPGHRAAQRKRKTHRLHSLGCQCQVQGTINHREAAFDSRRRPSEPFLCL